MYVTVIHLYCHGQACSGRCTPELEQRGEVEDKPGVTYVRKHMVCASVWIHIRPHQSVNYHIFELHGNNLHHRKMQ